MKTLRAAVVGAGHLGRYHGLKYSLLPGVKLAGVVDVDGQRAQSIAAECNTEAWTDYRHLLGHIDVASVAVPTAGHFEIARDLLRAGIHVLVEKPMTATVEQAEQLVQLAKENSCVLQVGHVERFNPVMRALVERIDNPAFIECYRIAPFKERGADINVVHDLMIHDIDLILKLVGEPVAQIEANGAKVISSRIDIANARIQFRNGCVANVTASRVSRKSERSMRIFQRNSYLSADLGALNLKVYRKDAGGEGSEDFSVECEQVDLKQQDALEAEISSFLDCARRGTRPLVSGEDGLLALETANEVIERIEHGQQWLPTSSEHPSRAAYL